MLAVTVREGEKVVDHRMCLLHKSEYEVVDDWHVLGMRSHRQHDRGGEGRVRPRVPGAAPCTTRAAATLSRARAAIPIPVYRVPLSALAAHGIGAVAVGNAQAALELSVEAVKARSTSYMGLKMRDIQSVQVRVGAAGARIDAARQLIRQRLLRGDGIRQAQRHAGPGRPSCASSATWPTRRACAPRRWTSCTRMAGANGIYDGYPIQRIFRDAHALGAHMSFNTDAQFSAWGLAALGGENFPPTL